MKTFVYTAKVKGEFPKELEDIEKCAETISGLTRIASTSGFVPVNLPLFVQVIASK